MSLYLYGITIFGICAFSFSSSAFASRTSFLHDKIKLEKVPATATIDASTVELEVISRPVFSLRSDLKFSFDHLQPLEQQTDTHQLLS